MNYQTNTTAKSTPLPVSLQEAKAQLRVGSDDLDASIQVELNAAVDYCERIIGRSLRVSHTVTQSYPGWPCAPVRFDRQPVTAISSVKYYDTDNAQQTVTSTNYRLIASSDAAAILEWLDTYSQPSHYERSDAIQIAYTAGYASIADVPAAAKHAILLQLEKTHFLQDLNPIQIGAFERSISSQLTSCDWGSYR